MNDNNNISTVAIRFNVSAGNIVRSNSDTSQGNPFMDCLVLKVEAEEVTLARPYAYVSGSHTSCPTCLLGYETIKLTKENLAKYYVLVVSSISGRPYSFIA